MAESLCSRAGQPLEPDLDHASGGKRQNPKTLPQTALLYCEAVFVFCGEERVREAGSLLLIHVQHVEKERQ